VESASVCVGNKRAGSVYRPALFKSHVIGEIDTKMVNTNYIGVQTPAGAPLKQARVGYTRWHLNEKPCLKNLSSRSRISDPLQHYKQ
jgi:hypothetical protein